MAAHPSAPASSGPALCLARHFQGHPPEPPPADDEAGEKSDKQKLQEKCYALYDLQHDAEVEMGLFYLREVLSPAQTAAQVNAIVSRLPPVQDGMVHPFHLPLLVTRICDALRTAADAISTRTVDAAALGKALDGLQTAEQQFFNELRDMSGTLSQEHK